MISDSRFSEDHPQLPVLQKQADDAAKAIAEQKSVYELRGLKFQQIGQLIDHLENWLRRMPASGMLPEARTLAVKPDNNVFDQIETIRQRIRHRRADLAAVRAAPISSSAAKKLARLQIEALAARGVPDCYSLIEIGAEIKWPRGRVSLPAGVGYGDAPDALALLAWLNKPALLSAIDAEIEACADDKAALSDDVRKQKLEEGFRDVLAYEREEELLITYAEANGAGILRRIDADPRAVLELASELPASEVG